MIINIEFEKGFEQIYYATFNPETLDSVLIVQPLHENSFLFNLGYSNSSEIQNPCWFDKNDYTLVYGDPICEDLNVQATEEYKAMKHTMLIDYGISIEDLFLDYDYINVYMEMKDK